jgi:RNA-directed DNA polymerase
MELMKEWKLIPWGKLERRVFKLQTRIFKASARGEVKVVRRLQKTLMRSWSAKCLAVRRITQDNQGKKTAGVDGLKSLTPPQRLELVNQLRLTEKAKPTRRVWIPKPGSKTEKRPLGIPTIAERALQTLVKQALEPEWEAKFEPNSYGFRPGRCAQDAIKAIMNGICLKAKYVLDGDISKCFDQINHTELLAKLNTFPKLRRQIKSWLKSGVLEDGQWFPTEAGTPQGGTASPLLANIALHGMETRIKQAFPKRERRVNGQNVGNRQPPHLIRYADDFVVLHEDLDVVQQCQQILIDWLAKIGLKLHPDKTRITHTLHPHEGQVGFDFLGFTVRQFPAGQYRTAHNSYGKPLGFKTLIKPSQTSIRRHQWKLKQIIYRHQAATQLALIDALNPVVIGWSNYFRSGVSSEIFSMLDHWLFYQLKYWAFHRHPRKNPGWIANKYWLIDRGEGWRFALKTADPRHRLAEHKDTAIQRHTKVQGQRSPYDADWVYWSSRMGRSSQVSPRVARLLKRQKGNCPFCQLYFREGDVLEIDHVIPRAQGGQNDYNNLQLLHRHCHDVKSANDGRLRCA